MTPARVELSPLAEEDCDDFLAAVERSRELHRSWISPPRTTDDFHALVRRADGDRFETFLVRLRDDGRIAGFISISEIIRRGFQSAFLGYGGVAGLEGRGYMTEGLWLVLEHAFTELGLHRLEANIQPANTSSIALVRRCGFVREGLSEKYLKVAGEWRDHERWATRVELWEQRQTPR